MIKQIGPTPIQAYHHLACHCGRVVMELHLPNGVVDPRRCDCSFCRQRGAIASTTRLADIRILQGKDKPTLYQFNTNVSNITSVLFAVSTFRTDPKKEYTCPLSV